MKSQAVVVGAEQLLDAELDLRTEVKSTLSSNVSLESRRLWNDPLRLPLDPPQIVDSGSQELSLGPSTFFSFTLSGLTIVSRIPFICGNCETVPACAARSVSV